MIPYEGTKPYLFISYAHKDSSRVLAILDALADLGFRMWYDAGIEAGTEWPEYIAEHLENAAVFAAFLSPDSVASVNCRQEINYAIDLHKPTLCLYLDDMELKGGMRMRLGLSQAIFYQRHCDLASFVNELSRAKILSVCRDEEKETDTKSACAEEKAAICMEDFDILDGVLVKYRGSGGALVIPQGVTKIGTMAFKGCTALTAVTLPEGVTEIGASAFSCCQQLKRVDLPQSLVRIERGAFRACGSLATLTLPEGLRRIEPFAFSECGALQKITMLGGEQIGEEAFSHCTSLLRLVFPRATARIGKNAFQCCTALTEVIFSDGTSSIGESAFFKCSQLRRAVIPRSVTRLGAYVFSCCDAITVYCEAPSKPASWEDNWNRKNYPVVWGYRA